MDYIFLANLQQEFALPEKGILSRVLQKDEFVNVTLFGFSAGEELSGHSAPTPAVLYFLENSVSRSLTHIASHLRSATMERGVMR